jgi:hypothetical protein
MIASEEHNFQGGSHAIHNFVDSNRPGKARDQGYGAHFLGELARSLDTFRTSGDTDIVTVVNAPNGDNVAKMVLALGALGNVCTRTVRAWSEAEFLKLVSELP